LAAAAANKADIHCEETVIGIDPSVDRDRVEVRTSKGRYMAEKVIVSAGAWIGTLLPELHLPLIIERQVVCWFQGKDGPLADRLGPADMPIYIWEYLPGKMFYGFPDLGNGIKIGFHHAGRHIAPGELQQDVSAEEIDEILVIARTYLDLEPVFDSASVCMYTNTPDENFIIDFHPGYRNILIASPCSGHGFKFSPVIGQLLSELATDQPVGFDLSPFALARLVG